MTELIAAADSLADLHATRRSQAMLTTIRKLVSTGASHRETLAPGNNRLGITTLADQRKPM